MLTASCKLSKVKPRVSLSFPLVALALETAGRDLFTDDARALIVVVLSSSSMRQDLRRPRILQHFILLGPVPAKYTGSMTHSATLKKAGAPVLGCEQFVTEIVSFLIHALIVFPMVRWASRLMKTGPNAPTNPPR